MVPAVFSRCSLVYHPTLLIVAIIMLFRFLIGNAPLIFAVEQAVDPDAVVRNDGDHLLSCVLALYPGWVSAAFLI